MICYRGWCSKRWRVNVVTHTGSMRWYLPLALDVVASEVILPFRVAETTRRCHRHLFVGGSEALDQIYVSSLSLILRLAWKGGEKEKHTGTNVRCTFDHLDARWRVSCALTFIRGPGIP